ncbi:MAG: RNA 3'-terminal phosphate cyclase [Phycisphaerae bacterium]|nr:RNA 3'-terminal phosphate cyclase [Phycisphaerae bacterium]
MSDQPILIDGSWGEGGGQILRTSLALAGATGQSVRVTGIRSGRPKPGLRPQHLAAVQAAVAVCDGQVRGDRIGSQELTFVPGRPQSGRFHFDIGTAGSTVLVAQTILPVLLAAEGRSEITITGGTHNPLAPCFEYLRDVFAVLASAANVQAYFELTRAGFYPTGGGCLHMAVQGLGSTEMISPVQFVSRGELKHIDGVSAASACLPAHVIERQTRQAIALLAAAGHRATLEEAAFPDAGPGTVVFLRAVFTRTVAGFFALGALGKPAERVATEAAEALLAFVDSSGAIDPFAADQLLTLAALASGPSRLATQKITDHLLTNAEVIRRLTGRTVTIAGEVGDSGMVTVEAI